jgi:uncharacterized iron-regulated membrane protein
LLKFETYWPLLLVGVVPYLWWVRSRSLADLPAKHLRVSTIVRSALIVLLALALMQPVVSRTGSWISVAYLVDVSQSIAPESLSESIAWIEETTA